MTKNTLLLLFSLVSLFTTPTLLFSQELTTNTGIRNTKFGARAGVNFSNLSTQNASDNILIGLSVGAFAKVPVTKYFAFQPEVNFTIKGATVDYTNPLVTGSAKYAFNYLEVPLLGVINFTENISIHGGPYVAYLLSGSTKNSSNANIFNFETSINPDNYNRMDIGAALGVSLDIDRIGIGMRYSRGFSTIGKESTVSGVLIKFPDAINSVYSMYLALSF